MVSERFRADQAKGQLSEAERHVDVLERQLAEQDERDEEVASENVQYSILAIAGGIVTGKDGDGVSRRKSISTHGTPLLFGFSEHDVRQVGVILLGVVCNDLRDRRGL